MPDSTPQCAPGEGPLQWAQALGHGLGDRRIDILRRIGATGSISQAAREAGVSYKAAWQAIETLSNLAGVALLEKVVGGTGGGGARLTPAGERLLAASEHLQRARDAVLERLQQAPDAAGNTGLAALALRTSMRNQFPCVVHRLRSREGMVQVELHLSAGAALQARITRESAQLLALAPGQSVLALCKATAVRVAATVAPQERLNLLPGMVHRVTRAAAGGEAVVSLEGGVQMVGFVAPGHGLRAGRSAVAAVEESAVVIALPG